MPKRNHKNRSTRLNKRQLATVLAALRYWQQDLVENEEPPISPHFHDVTPLTDDEIDELCDQLNAMKGH